MSISNDIVTIGYLVVFTKGLLSLKKEYKDISLEEILLFLHLSAVSIQLMNASDNLLSKTKKIIERSSAVSQKYGQNYIGTEHLLIGIMREGDSVAVRIMMDLNVNPQKLYNEINKMKGVSE